MLVEVCANSLESALNAQEAGADRIELCSELGVGGITPSFGLLKLVKEQLHIPVHVLIRPRSGHFSYTNHELETMLKDISFCRELGVEGIVSGVLHPNFELDIYNTQKLMAQAEGMLFTFHRAFDWVRNPKETYQKLDNLGVDYVLTSGQQVNAAKGLELLKSLNEASENCTVMAGGGVNPENISLFKNAKMKAIHLSGTTFGNSMDLKGKLPMNSANHLKEGDVAVTNTDKVRQIVHSVK